MIDISPEDLVMVKSILNTFLPGVPIWVFGSRTKGTARPFSDLDLVAITKEPLDIATYTDIKEAFSNSTLPFKVDLVDWSCISDDFRKIIEEHHVALI